MANGDDAQQAGMDKVLGTSDRRLGYDEDNKTRDYIAQFFNRVRTILLGGTGATTAAGARTNLGVPAVGEVTANDGAGTNSLGLKWENNRVRMRVDATTVGEIANMGDVQNLLNGISNAQGTANSAQGTANSASGDAVAARQGNLYTDSYNRSLNGTRRAAWLQDNGQLGYAASSERYKKNIRPEDVTDEQILQLSLVSYQWKAAVAQDDRREMGLIAERLVEAGLGWACFFGENGVEGINYEMVGLAVLPTVQRLIARVNRLEESV